jgi:hypothetical protein
VIKLVSHLRPVDGFLRVVRFPPPIKLSVTIYTEILLKEALNTINLNLKNNKYYGLFCQVQVLRSCD